jgi:hypothetical protein
LTTASNGDWTNAAKARSDCLTADDARKVSTDF